MLGNKQNVFDDCHAAAEYLVDAGFTTREQLSVMGGSNGGLLVGAAITQRPELYAAAVCSAPIHRGSAPVRTTSTSIVRSSSSLKQRGSSTGHHRSFGRAPGVTPTVKACPGRPATVDRSPAVTR